MIKDTRVRNVTLAITWTLLTVVAIGALAVHCWWTDDNGTSVTALKELQREAQPVWVRMRELHEATHPRPEIEVPPTAEAQPLRAQFFRYPYVGAVVHISPDRRMTWITRDKVEVTDMELPIFTTPITNAQWYALAKDVKQKRSLVRLLADRTGQYQRKLRTFDPYGGIYLRGSRETGYLGYQFDQHAFIENEGQRALREHNFEGKASWSEYSNVNLLRPEIELRSDMTDIHLNGDGMALTEASIELAKRFFLGLSLLTFALVGGIGETVRQIKALLDEREVALAQSNFVSAVSHEMRTPLTTIKMYAEMMEHGIVGDPDKQLAYLQTIGHESDRLARLVENVLGYAKVNRGNMVLAPVRLVVADVVEEAIVAAKGALEQAGVHVQTDVTPGLTVVADRDALVQMLVNLLTNAAKYAPEGKLVFVRAIEEGGKARLTVKDFGPGIPAAEHKKVFQPFYRIGSEMTRTTQGTGLGLALVDEYMKAQGGMVELESRPGDGAAFHLVFAKEAVAA